jgi:hypothetical protein
MSPGATRRKATDVSGTHLIDLLRKLGTSAGEQPAPRQLEE